MDGVIPSERRCYLYEGFDRAYRGCGEVDIQRAMESGEGLQHALLKDKAGYRFLDGEEQLRRGATIDRCYREFLNRMRPDFILSPDLEVVDGFILMNLAKEFGIGILYFASMRLLGGGYFSSDSYETLPPYFGEYTAEDLALARRIVRVFRDGRPTGRDEAYPPVAPPKPPWLRRLVLTSWLRWKYERLHVSEETLRMRLTRNILPLMAKVRRARFELAQSHHFHIMSDRDSLPEKYIFYPLHMTPESSINGLAPYFVDQFRAIDALLLNLPKGHCLVVKEHPAMYGMRQSSFYQEVRRRPGLLMVHPAVNTRHLMTHASIIVTVTGTVGLETFLLDKPCMLFGPSFFSHLCREAPALNELRDTLADMAERWRPPSDEQKEIEIAKLLNVSSDFLIADPWFCQMVMAPQNIAAAREYLHRHLRRLAQSGKARAQLSTCGSL